MLDEQQGRSVMWLESVESEEEIEDEFVEDYDDEEEDVEEIGDRLESKPDSSV